MHPTATASALSVSPFPPDPKGPALPPEALGLLEKGVEAARTSGGWRAYLEAQSRFHAYSFNNTMLILQQRPGAARVAGYRAWQDLGRWVRKGERGLLILAPILKREVGDDGEPRERLVGFRTIRVFDVAQTDGEPLPERPAIALADGPSEAARAATVRLKLALAVWGYPVSSVSDLPDGVLGTCDRHSGEIQLRAGLGDVQGLSTLLHEAAHARLHTGEGRAVPQDRAVREFEAESTAFVVMHRLGLDVSGFSFAYLASYGATAETIRAVGPRVQGCAKALLGAIGAS